VESEDSAAFMLDRHVCRDLFAACQDSLEVLKVFDLSEVEAAAALPSAGKPFNVPAALVDVNSSFLHPAISADR